MTAPGSINRLLTNAPTSLDGRHQATCWGQAAAEISHAQARHWKVRDCRFPEPQSPPGHQRREYRDFDGDDFWCLCWTAGVPGLKLFWRLRQEMLNISNMKMKHYNCWVLVLIKTWGPSLSLNFQHWATLNIFTSDLQTLTLSQNASARGFGSIDTIFNQLAGWNRGEYQLKFKTPISAGCGGKPALMKALTSCRMYDNFI